MEKIIQYTQHLEDALEALSLTPQHLEATLLDAHGRIAHFQQQVQQGEFPAFDAALSHGEEKVASIKTWAKDFDHVVFFGMGGSSLGGKLIDYYADSLKLEKPNLHFVDFLAPCALADLMTKLPLAKTGVVSISKSGGTAETLTQTFLMASRYEKKKLDMAKHWRVVTEPKESPLANFANAHGIPILPHDPKVGGRFSIMIETGLLPAALKGVDITAYHQGMREVVDDFMQHPLTCAPALGAALHALAKEKGKTINLMYAYGERLRYLLAWFEQLWAESLGKGGKGTTPLGAVGPCTQHSAQQLFLDGPADKLITLLLPHVAGLGTEVPEQPFQPSLTGVKPGTLQQAMGEGTKASLIARNHPVRTFEVEKLDAHTLGALLMHFMLETVITAAIWDVNPFDQPAVEESKKYSLTALEKLK